MQATHSTTASSHITQSPVASTSGSVLSATPRRSPRIRKPPQSTPRVLDKETDDGNMLAAEARTEQSRQRSKAPSPRIATNKREFSEAFSTSTPAPENDDDSDRRRPSRTTRNPSPRPLAKKKQKKKGSFARQVPSQPVQDPIKEGLDIVMCGMNSGGPALESGQYYSDKNSWFWELLEKSGLTDRVLRSTEADILLNQYGIGITVLIPDADIDMNKVPKLARPAYVPALIEKIGRYRPRVLTLSGVGVCEAFKLHFSSLPSGSGLDLTDNLGLQPISLSFPPRDPTDDSKRDKVLVWCVPYPHQMVSKWYPNEAQLELFRRMKDDLAKLKAGTLVLPSDHVEYRVEDLLPSIFDDPTAEEGPAEGEENKREGKVEQSWGMIPISRLSREV
ncbi:hypothetical protein JCM16303_002823 [Sporobolomyces ruberrimus]